ncbi:anthranilate phosphoribosyltransferase [Thermoflexibacter ruber]|uniref:Anthranilate phosphoribosyltransferase n=1 Tax=Thermoflexibacter ruber TaxID=1003 RepID=A0A1I2AYG1_9BACT|nr:anthranilate phosphoribosyltransferase [Thermoflexibacter ruber]SFE48787.1 anthranilate phosphoribosyltransferase [Thermoflexibacter ruber]
MKEILNHLFEYKTLSKEISKEVLMNLAQGKYNNSQVASFITVFLMRSVTVEELSGFREAMMELCIPLDVSAYNTIDVCGTGGDAKDSFNISTITSFVVAGAGQMVVKHGNYGVSSVSGSSNVLQYFGYNFTNDKDFLIRKLETCNICFLHAPLFHPAMKNVAPVRKELGVKTFFNMLGPMVNPANPNNQFVGVFSLELARLYGYLYQGLNKNYAIVHSLDGYDEISLTGNFKVIGNEGERILHPRDLAMHQYTPKDLYGGETVEEAAKIVEKVLSGEGSNAQNEVVIANATIALKTAQPKLTMEEAKEKAEEALFGGEAKKVFLKLIEN